MISAILSDIGILTIISVVLAVLIVIAQRYLADYGDCKISINNKRILTVKGGSSLLSSLSEQGIFIPSACGGRGSCGACKCKVPQGAGPLLPTEKPYMSDSELQSNVRLSCQVKVRNDLSITIPEEIFNIRRYRTVVEEIVDYTYDIKGVVFKLLDPDQVDFKAGQYMQLETPKYGKQKQSVVRAYSISSKPEDTDRIQLIIRLVPEGICTTWVHNFLNVGDEAWLTGPYGDFFIRDTDADIIFVAGGSGKAPIKSMLEHLAITGTNRKMTYYFGARTTKDLYLTDHMKSFEQVFPDFRYEPVLSMVTEEDKWDGKTGYIMPYMKEVIRDPKNTEAYLCGSPAMINAITKSLIEYGVPKEKIYFDSFG